MEVDHSNLGYETCRKQARLHEELAQRERALRKTHIRSIHDVEELNRAQEMRNDEFSRQELTESQATIQQLTSQTQALQDRVNLVNDSRKFQDVESICSGEWSNVPSQTAIVPSLSGMLSRNQSLRPETWNLLGTSGNVFDCPREVIGSSSAPYRGMLHSWDLNARCQTVQGDLLLEAKNEIEMLFQRRYLQGNRQPWNLYFQKKGAHPQNYMADDQRLQISELHFDKFPHQQRFYVGR